MRIHANMHLCIHAYVRETCIHATMLAYVHKFTSMHSHMRASVHTAMPAYKLDERDVLSGVMGEKESASVMQPKDDFTEIILSPLTLDSFAFSRSHQTSSLSLSLPAPTNMIPSLLLETRFSLSLSHSLTLSSRQIL